MQINTNLNPLYLSASLPAVIEIAAEKSSAKVTVLAGAEKIFSSTLFAYMGLIQFYDIRGIIEGYLLRQALTDADFSLAVEDETSTISSATFKVIMSMRLVDDADAFVRDSFLTSRTSFIITHGQRQALSWFAPADETPLSQVAAVVKDESGNVSVENISSESYTPGIVNTIIITPESVEQNISQGKKLVAFTVRRGERMITFYVSEKKEDIAFAFINSFNVTEYIYFPGVTQLKQKVERSEARINNKFVFYDQEVTQEYKVKTALLSMEEAEALNELYSARYAWVKNQANNYNEVLITDDEVNITDADNEEIRAEFTYRLADNRRQLPAPVERIFTDVYQPTFS